MPRKPVVSRTLTTTIATVGVLDHASGSISYRDVVIARSVGETKALKVAKAKIDSDSEHAVFVKTMRVEENTYTVTEQEFLDFVVNRNKNKKE